MARLSLVSIVVDDYDRAVSFFVDGLGFELVEDSPATGSHDGHPKRWVEVRPPGAETSILLAKASTEEQQRAIGNQTGGRVGFFLEVEDFDGAHQRMLDAGVIFREEPRNEPYGKVAVFEDVSGNTWDLLGPDPRLA